MREFLQLLATVVLVIASMAQTPATQSGQADKRQPDPCTISGRVVTAAEGTPIKSARVALVEQNAARHPHVFAASTDNDGRFEIKKVDPGRYEFVASHTAYISQRYQARGTNDGAILALVPGQEVNAVLFRLVRGGAITGRVIDEAGEPMVSVLPVSILQKASAEEIEEAGPRGKNRELLESSSATTDDRGEYRVFGLKPGDYYIKAAETGSPRGQVVWDGTEWMIRQELGSQYAPLFYPGVVQVDQAQAVSLAAGEEVQADFAMRHVKMVEVSGRILAADGGPATDAYVDLSVPEVGDRSQRLHASTDAKGEFAIKSSPRQLHPKRAEWGSG